LTSFVKDFFSGGKNLIKYNCIGIAGAISKTIAAPIERVKLLY
jgi:hypothetical protein